MLSWVCLIISTHLNNSGWWYELHPLSVRPSGSRSHLRARRHLDRRQCQHSIPMHWVQKQNKTKNPRYSQPCVSQFRRRHVLHSSSFLIVLHFEMSLFFCTGFPLWFFCPLLCFAVVALERFLTMQAWGTRIALVEKDATSRWTIPNAMLTGKQSPWSFILFSWDLVYYS